MRVICAIALVGLVACADWREGPPKRDLVEALNQFSILQDQLSNPTNDGRVLITLARLTLALGFDLEVTANLSGIVNVIEIISGYLPNSEQFDLDMFMTNLTLALQELQDQKADSYTFQYKEKTYVVNVPELTYVERN